MEQIVDIWVYLSSSPLLWLTATLAAYLGGSALHRAAGQAALLNPVLLAVAALVAVLLASDTPYSRYFDGAQFVHFLLGPATVALAVPLYRQGPRLRQLWLPVLGGLVAGSATAVGSALALGWLLGLSRQSLMSLLPKSITTPVAMGVAEQVGGLASLTAVLVIATGITGAVLAVPLLSLVRLRDPAVQGLAIGVAAHGIGTARAFQISSQAGAFSGLGMGLNALLTALLVPALVWLTGL